MVFLISVFLLKNGMNISGPQRDWNIPLHGAIFSNQEIIV